MGDVGCLMIFVCLLASVYPENYSTKYQTNLNFQKKTCNDEDIAFMLHNVPTSLTCSSICASDDDCESFFYFPKSLRCDGCKQTYSTDGQLKGAGEQTVYYSMAVHLTTTSTVITTTTTTEGKDGYIYSGCFIVLCEGYQFCNYSIRIPLIDINVTSCFVFCDYHEGFRVSAIALEAQTCYCGLLYNPNLTADCDEPCEGNPDEMCGGNYTMSVYIRNG